MYVHCAASGRLNQVNSKFTEYRTSPNMKIKASDAPNLFLKTILFLWGNDSKFDRGRMGLVRYFKKIPSWTEPVQYFVKFSSVDDEGIFSNRILFEYILLPTIIMPVPSSTDYNPDSNSFLGGLGFEANLIWKLDI